MRQGLSASTANLRAHSIMRWFKWQGKKIVLECPSIKMKEPEYLALEDVKRLLAQCRTPFETVLIAVLFDTAVRVSELMNLEISDIDFNRRTIMVTRKGGRREEVNISKKALDTMEDWLNARTNETDRVFMDYEYQDAWRAVTSLGKRVGVKVHPHLLRHSRAIHMLKSGATLNDVKIHLGHRSIMTTADIYGAFKAIDLKDRIPAW